MKVAIFGDSFAALNNNRIDKPYFSWIDLLRQHHTVTNFAAQASSLYFSYKNFKAQYGNFDVYIFLATQIDRIYVPHLPKTSQGKQESPHFTPADSARSIVFQNYTEQQLVHIKNITKTVGAYYEYLHDHAYAVDMYYLMANDIKKHKDLIFVECFNSSKNAYFPEKIRSTNELALIDFWKMENKDSGLDDYMKEKNIQWDVIIDNKVARDNRVCHLSKENNTSIAQKLLNCIETKNYLFDLTMEDYVPPEKNPTKFIRTETVWSRI